MTAPSDEKQRPARRRLAMVLAGGAAGIAAGVAAVAAVYGIAGFMRNPADPACQPAVETARRIAPLLRGEIAGLTLARDPRRLPLLAFHDASGSAKTLANWQGRTVLLNLWATWCVPCRKEMPALDSLQEKLGGADFEVVAVNIDTRDADKPKAWLKEAGVARLAYYADPSAKVFQELKAIGKAIGMPTTLLIDANGCEIASLAGPAEWASEDAVKLIAAAVKGE